MDITETLVTLVHAKRGKAFLPVLAGCLIAVTAAGGFYPAAHAAKPCIPGNQPALEVTWQHGFLSVHTRDTPLYQVLEDIGAATGAEIVLHGALDAPVSGCFEPAHVGEVLQRLAPKAVDVTVTVQKGVGAQSQLVKVIVHGVTDGERNDLSAKNAVDNRSIEDRILAVQALARSPAAGAPETLTRILKSDPDATVRAQAARALASAGGPRDLNTLLAALGDSDKTVRMQAARAMGRIGGQQAVQALSDALLHEDDPGIRTTAAWSLARLGGETAQRALVRAQDASDPAVRRIARQALGRWEAALAADSGEAQQ